MEARLIDNRSRGNSFLKQQARLSRAALVFESDSYKSGIILRNYFFTNLRTLRLPALSYAVAMYMPVGKEAISTTCMLRDDATLRPFRS